MAGYLVEYRFHGYARRYSRDLMYDVAKRFGTRGVTGRGRPVPHITLFGPFSTRHERRMVSEVANACKNYDLVPFRIEGFGHFDDKVIYIRVRPSETFEDLRRDIAERLLEFVDTKSPFDAHFGLSFHATIAFRDIERKFGRIWNYIEERPPPNINQHVLRVTILRGHKILGEYDLLQRRLLSRREARSKHSWRKTFELLKQRAPGCEPDIEEYEALPGNMAKRLNWRVATIRRESRKYFKRARLKVRAFLRGR
jgi:2'-5' RNA ligase